MLGLLALNGLTNIKLMLSSYRNQSNIYIANQLNGFHMIGLLALHKVSKADTRVDDK